MPDQENRFYIRVTGDAKPYNNPLEAILDMSFRLHETNRQRLVELVGEIAALKTLSGPTSRTFGELLSDPEEITVVFRGSAEPFNDLDELQAQIDQNIPDQ